MVDIVLPSRRNIIVATAAAAYQSDGDDPTKLFDWAAARNRVVPRIDMGWITSNFVDLSPPEDLRANENGHIFQLADGEKAYPMIRDTPLNWLHHEQFIVGHYVDAEIVRHGKDLADLDKRPPGAHIETLATFYRAIYPRHWQKVKEAHDAGLLHSSMEARPKSITCQTEGCCGETFPFITAWDPSYCDGLLIPKRKFLANEPHFLGGACVVPPHKPGWKGASAIEVATYIEQNPDDAEQLFNQIAASNEELSDEACEAILVALLDAAGAGGGDGGRSRISMAGSGDFQFHLPDNIKLPTVHDVRTLDTKIAARRATVLEAEANHQGVIIALVPPPEVRTALAAMGDEPVDEIHVTLAFLADSMGQSEITGPDGPVTLERLNAMVAVFAAAERPITAKLSGIGRFELDAGNEVTYASVDAPGLNEFRARLVEYLRAGGVPVANDHGFTPHATIQYHRAGEGPTELPEGLEWEVDAIELWWGSDFHDAHSLGGVSDFDDAVAALAIDAVAAATEWSQVEPFAQAARVNTLQAVVDSGAGDHHQQITGRLAQVLIDRKFTTDQRAELAKKGQAMPDGSFPTPTRADWMNARAAIGRAASGDRAKVIAYLKRRAKALGIDESEIPDSW